MPIKIYRHLGLSLETKSTSMVEIAWVGVDYAVQGHSR